MISDFKVEAFLSLAQTLNFSKTAKNLHVTQQAVSKSIASFEDDLGVRLFNRTRNYVLLTDAGRSWLEFFRDYKARFKQKQSEILAMRESGTSCVNIGYPDFAEFFDVLEEITNAGLKRGGRLINYTAEQCSPDIMQERLAGGKLDIALLCQSLLLGHEKTKSLVLAEIPVVVMVSPSNPHIDAIKSSHDFSDAVYIINKFKNESEKECMKRAAVDLKTVNIECKNIKTAPNRPSAYSMVEMGDGFLLSTVISRGRKNPLLETIPTEGRDNMLCLWRSENTSEEIELTVKMLKKAVPDKLRTLNP